jgi:hypothetical protein
LKRDVRAKLVCSETSAVSQYDRRYDNNGLVKAAVRKQVADSRMRRNLATALMFVIGVEDLLG